MTTRHHPSPPASLPEFVNGLPNMAVTPDDAAWLQPGSGEMYATVSDIPFDKVQSSFGIALHMHQPTIPASSDDIRTAGLISNLQHMMEHQGEGDNHNASVFAQCYSRISDIVRELVGQGHSPRVMLDYSGNLLWGLRQMNHGWVLDNLKAVTCDPAYHRNVEWVGTMWSHAVATSTPVPDLLLHMVAWRRNFAAVFGIDALRRVKGFSPPEMHLPIHPDVCHAYIKALRACGYQWLMVQEHTIENLDGSGIRHKHLPHRLVAKNSLGETEEITAIIKTQGSDTKLVAQMQPLYEAKSLGLWECGGKQVPPFVFQIGDGENGGVMMNEFPPCYRRGYGEISREGPGVALNGSEYLEFLARRGITGKEFTPVQPISQHRIWAEVKKPGPGACDEAIARIKSRDAGFNLDKGSWTSDRSWVRGYEDVLDPLNRLSAAFHQRYGESRPDTNDRRYHEALLHLLLAETSCFRYWGSGIWTEYAKEIVRRGMDLLAG